MHPAPGIRLLGKGVGQVNCCLDRFVVVEAVFSHEPGKVAGIDPASQVVPGRDGGEGTSVVDEA